MPFVVHHPRLSSFLLLAAVLLLAAALRFAGLDWDGGRFIHPDERRILMVVEGLRWPNPWDWSQVLSPRSPLNPRFFAYGSLPIYLLRLLGAFVGSRPGELYLPGRVFSATLDLLTVAAVYATGCELGGRRVGALAGALLACTVLSIQLAHFLTVDSLLALLCTLTVWCLLRVARSGSLRAGLLAGVLGGLALATKTSALPLLCAGWAAWVLWALPPLRSEQGGRHGVPRLGRGAAGLAVGTAAAGLAFVAAEPYSLLDWFRFGLATAQESAMASGAADLPYTRQYIGTANYLYPLRELVVWSMGVPLGLVALAGLIWLTWRALRPLRSDDFSRSPTMAPPLQAQAGTTKGLRRECLVVLAWVWPYLLITGSFQAKFSRYMAPLVPWLCLAAALFLWRLWELARTRRWARRAVLGLGGVTLLATLLYALAFTGIYLRPHPWLAAGDWFERHVPAGAVLASEEWDDELPARRYDDDPAVAYGRVTLDLYAPDGGGGLDEFVQGLAQADYVVIASQRLYGAIGRLPGRYPLAAAYYRLLFSEQLGFRLAHVEAGYPQLGPLALVDEPFDGTVLPRPVLPQPAPLALSLGRADESYSVYDHPRVMIFRKDEALSPQELKARIQAAGMPAQAAP